MAIETHLKDDDAFLLPLLVLPQRKSWEPHDLVPLRTTTTTGPPRDEGSPNTAQQPFNPSREAALHFLATKTLISAQPDANFF